MLRDNVMLENKGKYHNRGGLLLSWDRERLRTNPEILSVKIIDVRSYFLISTSSCVYCTADSGSNELLFCHCV
jgi:hypothetical protein